MKTIRFDALLIEQMKGTERREITPHGRDVVVGGQTGAGKTTIADAVNWLFNNKDAAGKTGSELRPKHRSGPEKDEPIRGLVMVVEAKVVLEGFGGAMNGNWTLRKEEHEHCQKTKLEGRSGFKYSYPKKYFINGDVVLEKDFNAWLQHVADPDIIRMLTDKNYFLADEKAGGMHHGQRRALLRNMGGNIGVPEGFEDILKATKDRKLVGYKKEVSERKAWNESGKQNPLSLDKIPTAIKENQLKVDAGAGSKSELMLKAEREIQIEELATIAAGRKELVQTEQVRAKAQEKLTGLKASQSERETFLANDMSAVEALVKEEEGLRGEARAEQQTLNAAIDALAEADRANTNAKSALECAMIIRDGVLQQAKAVEESKSPKPCPSADACPYAVATEDAILRRAATVKASQANKVKALAAVNDANTAMDAARTSYNSLLEARNTLADVQVVSAGKRLARYAEIAEAIKTRPRVQPKDDKTWCDIQNVIEADTEKLGDPVSEQLEILEDRKKDAEDERDDLNKRLNAFDATEQAKARIVTLKKNETALAQSILDDEQILRRIELFMVAESELISKAVNDRFKDIEFRLFKTNLNGGQEECCDPMLHGVTYAGASSGEKMLMQVDAAQAVGTYHGLRMPLVLDDRHALTQDLDLDCQVIALHTKVGQKELAVEVI